MVKFYIQRRQNADKKMKATQINRINLVSDADQIFTFRLSPDTDHDTASPVESNAVQHQKLKAGKMVTAVACEVG